MASGARKDSKTVEYDGKEYDIVREGLAEILKVHLSKTNGPRETHSVFYNPIQQFNRDLSVLAIRAFAEDYRSKRETKDRKAKKRKRLLPNKTASDESGSEKWTSEPGSKSKVSEIENVFGTIVGERESINPQPNFRLKILDALSASGLRALRYAKELPLNTTVVANDLSVAAAQSIDLNVQHNRLQGQVFPLSGSAQTHMYRVACDNSTRLPDGSLGRYHVIDIDPYGTAAPFLDAAVQAVVDGGLLCITCTDTGVLASAGYCEKTYSQYGGLPLRGAHSHEGGLRLILHAVATSAARYGIAIEPMLSLSIDFYMRVFVRIRRSPIEVKLLAGKTMLVYSCDSGCGAWTTQLMNRTQHVENKYGESYFKFRINQAPNSGPQCEHCGFKTHLGGPMWAGPLHNPFFVQRMLDIIPTMDKTTYQTIPRIEGMLSTARDELFLPEPLSASSILKCAIESSPTHDGRKCVEKETTVTFDRLPNHFTDPHPFFFIPSSLAKVLHCTSPSVAALRSAFLGLGYRTARSHAKPGSVKTNAPWSVVWKVMREWSRQHAPVKDGAIKDGTAGKGLWQQSESGMMLSHRKDLRAIADGNKGVEETKKDLEAFLWRISNKNHPEETESGTDFTIVFDEARGREVEDKKLLRYQMNPHPNWGPMSRAKITNA